MALNGLGSEKIQQPKPVTLAKLIFKESDIEREAREAAARVAERKVMSGRRRVAGHRQG